MSDRVHFTGEQVARINEKLENLLIFVQDVLDDPAILDQIPNGAAIELTPIERKEAGADYVAESQHIAVSITREHAITEDELRKQSA